MLSVVVRWGGRWNHGSVSEASHTSTEGRGLGGLFRPVAGRPAIPFAAVLSTISGRWGLCSAGRYMDSSTSLPGSEGAAQGQQSRPGRRLRYLLLTFPPFGVGGGSA